MRVVNDKVMVKVRVDEEVTASGIILTSASHDRFYEGVVTGVGENPDIANCGITVGTYVYYPKGLNTEVVIDDVVYDIVSVYDILAIGNEEEE